MNRQEQYKSFLENYKKLQGNFQEYTERAQQIQTQANELQDEAYRLYATADDLDREMKKQVETHVYSHLKSLAQVGWSVILKTCGYRESDAIAIADRFHEEDDDLRWIYGAMVIKDFSDSHIFVTMLSQKDVIRIPISYLSLNEREFARKVREHVGDVKASDNTQRIKELENRMVEIQQEIKHLRSLK